MSVGVSGGVSMGREEKQRATCPRTREGSRSPALPPANRVLSALTIPSLPLALAPARPASRSSVSVRTIDCGSKNKAKIFKNKTKIERKDDQNGRKWVTSAGATEERKTENGKAVSSSETNFKRQTTHPPFLDEALERVLLPPHTHQVLGLLGAQVVYHEVHPHAEAGVRAAVALATAR